MKQYLGILAGVSIVLIVVLLFHEGIISTDMITGNKSDDAPIESKENKGKVRKFFRDNGTLEKFITVKDGKQNGIAKRYYEDGKTVMLEMEYADNVKIGEEKKYYKNGELYRIRNYVAGKRTGKEIRYYQNGKLMTEQTYLNGFPGNDLVEYGNIDKPLTKYPEIKVRSLRTSHGKKITFNLSNNSKKVTFYIGKLKDGVYVHENLRILPEKNGKSTMTFPYTYASDTETVVAVYTTRKRAKKILTKTIIIR